MHTVYARNSRKRDKKNKNKGKTMLMFLKITKINQQVNRQLNLLIYKNNSNQ